MIVQDAPERATLHLPSGLSGNEIAGEPDDWSATLTTRHEFTFRVRSADPDDQVALGEFFEHVSPDDMCFRFLTALRKVDADRLHAMTHVDHRRTENFLAFDHASGTLIATAMLAADAALETAEVAIAIRSDYKQRGVSWTLLAHLARFAKAKGFRSIESVESRAHHAAIDLEREMGFVALPCPGDPTLVIVRATFDPVSSAPALLA